MTPSCLRLVPTDARNFAFFYLNKPVLLLLKVANLNDDLKGDFGKKAMAFTPTLSSPQPQAGATAGRLIKALLSAVVAGPQETTLNFNPLSFGLAATIDTTKGSFSSCPPLFRQYTHLELGSFNVSVLSLDFTGLFNFTTIFNFETLFNILVILGLLYLFFTPPVSGCPGVDVDSPRTYNNHQVDDDTTAYEFFGLVDTIPHDFELDGSENVCHHCHNSTMGAVRAGQPRQTWSTSGTKQVALVSSSRSLCHTPIKRYSAPRTPSRTTPAENPDRPVQPTSTIEPPTQVNPMAISSRQQTTDMAQATRPDSRGFKWWWDLNTPHIKSDSESISSTETTPSSYDRSSSRMLPIRFHSDACLLFIPGRHQHC